MSKVFYNLTNDVIDRQIGYTGIIDILQMMKCNVLTELSQLKGEKIDVAFIDYNETLMSQLNDLNIKKISVISKGLDRIFVPHNFIKYSSDKMVPSPSSMVSDDYINVYNIILNNKNYKTNTEILLCGKDHIMQDVLRNIYLLYGNVITNTYNKYNIEEIRKNAILRNLPNCDDIYVSTFTILEGLKNCTIKNNIIKTKTDELFSDLTKIITELTSEEKIITTNVGFQKVNKIKFGISNHLIAGKYAQLYDMYANALEILNNKVTELRKKLRLEYTPEQILTLGYLKGKLDFIGAKDNTYVKQIICKYFHIVPIDDLGLYMIPFGNKMLDNNKKSKNVDRDELYNTLCQVKTTKDL